MMFGYGNDYNCFGNNFWAYGLHIFGLILLVIIVYTVIKLIRSDQTHNQQVDVLNQLNMKFVNGDISEEEYQKKKKAIKKHIN